MVHKEILIIVLMVGLVSADDGCRDVEVLKCYSCSSVDNGDCAEPFNYSKPIPTETCRGWCAKIVEFADTENERIQRTCTDKMHINPFIVGNMCMEESSGRGSLCFCRKDRCNSSPRGGATLAVLLSACILLLCFTGVLTHRVVL